MYSGICGEPGQVAEIPEIFVGLSLETNEPDDAPQGGQTVPANRNYESLNRVSDPASLFKMAPGFSAVLGKQYQGVPPSEPARARRYFGASEATILSKRESVRNGSHSGLRRKFP